MFRGIPRGLTAAAALLTIASGAHAHVLDGKADKPEFDLRANVARQTARYTACVAKAAITCEMKGALSSPECSVATGAVAYETPAGKQTARFQKALAACDARLDLLRKGSDYAGIGCPGDCDGDPGLQQCSDLGAYEGQVVTAARAGHDSLSAAIDAACAGSGTPDSDARIKCADAATRQLVKYTSAVFHCAQKCETDATGRSGGGALTNLASCRAGAGGAFDVCEGRAASRLTSAAAIALRPLVASSVGDATDALFNREDATDPATPAGTQSPCGTCGDGDRAGTEECDGADLNGCDACAADCTCTPAVCGNGAIEGSEACDGASLGACSLCAADCSCAIDPILDGPAGTGCSAALNPAVADYQALCVPSAGSGRHFRIEGAQTIGNNGFFYLALGFPAAPTGNPTIAAGDGRFIFTGGKSQSCSYAWSYFRYSGITDPSSASLCTIPSIFGDYPLGPQTVCLDVTTDNPPRVTFWATGANGANCKDASTLTAATALYSKSDWASANNQPVATSTHFLKLSNPALASFSSAAVSSNTVLP